MAGNMNSGGRNRKSAKIKVIEGGRGHRRIEPEIEATGAPKMPDYFSRDQQSLWNDLIASMPVGTFKAADSALLEMFVIVSLRLREAEMIVADSGLLIAGAQGITRNPALMIITAAEKQIVSLSDRLGLSPAARTRLHVGKDEDADEMAWLMN
ncbi:hypothetical protein BLJAPNOD_02988 [Ensifer sp. M14]|uniref:phage terminase small subunit P27 family n=1 Tax=Ensifer sp. M14 TaxID=2203782 RepID=UPI000E2DE8BB|nr:phage terminase small subunit P27 family [Ensifer sp. M14]RDL51842.1 hypothetical protein BLJAPNOD_02988 [Ensifer sp. M14]